MENKLFKMEIDEALNLGDGFTQVLRVYNGWIYNQCFENKDGKWQTTSVFVPEVLNSQVQTYQMS